MIVPATPRQIADAQAFARPYLAKSKAVGLLHNGTNRLGHAFYSKLAEMAWSDIIGGQYDLSIGKAQFGPDLTNTIQYPLSTMFSFFDIHVKSANVGYTPENQPGNYSWTVDKADPVRHTPQENDLFCLALHDDRGDIQSTDINVLGFIKAVDVMNYYVPSSHLNHKDAFYLNSIQHKLFLLP